MKPPSQEVFLDIESHCVRFLEGVTTAPTFFKRGTVITTEEGKVWALSAVRRPLGKNIRVVVGVTKHPTEPHFFVVDAKD